MEGGRSMRRKLDREFLIALLKAVRNVCMLSTEMMRSPPVASVNVTSTHSMPCIRYAPIYLSMP